MLGLTAAKLYDIPAEDYVPNWSAGTAGQGRASA